MIVNLIDATLGGTPGNARATLDVIWYVGSPVPLTQFHGIRPGEIDCMRVLAPHRNIVLLLDLIGQSLSWLRPLFAPRGYLEIYGRQGSAVIGSDTFTAALGRDGFDTVGGTLGGDTINATLGSDTVTGPFAPDLLWAVKGSERIYVRP